MKLLQIGDRIPDIMLPATDGQQISLSNYANKNIIIYFYPRDDTPGCTTEARDFAALYPKFLAHNAVVLGISRDSVVSHDKFKCKYDLPFPLLSDSDEKLCKMFDVIKDKNMMGKIFRGIERSTFLIDATGHLRQVWRKVKVANHAQEVLAKIQSLPQ